VAQDRLGRLSRRERQVMELLAAGLRVREIAREMSLTEKTVRNYLSSIYEKLNVHSQAEAILCWIGHLEPPERGAAFRSATAELDPVDGNEP
jgi:DNA-binding NarL/FixJ family response regulator